jgi:hypothetical protein
MRGKFIHPPQLPKWLRKKYWRVEWVDDDGGTEVAVFSGPNARGRALRYADRQYGNFQEVSLEPYRRRIE